VRVNAVAPGPVATEMTRGFDYDVIARSLGCSAESARAHVFQAFKKIRTDMHVILALETEGMVGKIYDRPPLPATWARMFGSGRVFYTSLGHREDVWAEAVFQQIALGGLAWALGNVDADVTPNFNQVTPKGRQHEKVPYEPGTVSR